MKAKQEISWQPLVIIATISLVLGFVLPVGPMTINPYIVIFGLVALAAGLVASPLNPRVKPVHTNLSWRPLLIIGFMMEYFIPLFLSSLKTSFWLNFLNRPYVSFFWHTLGVICLIFGVIDLARSRKLK